MAGLDKRNGNHVRKIALELQERFLADKQVQEAPVAKVEQKRIINAPLDFELKTLDPTHPYFAGHKLTPETVEHFGLGYCNRGVLKGRITIDTAHVWLMFDKSIADADQQNELLWRIAQSRFCRWTNFKVGETVNGFSSLQRL